MRVRDVMTRNPVFITPDATVTDAKLLMSRQKITKLPVLDDRKHVVGIVTNNDLLKASPSQATTLDMYEIGYLLSRLTVEKVMKKDVITVSDDEVIEEAARIMGDNDISCLPVIKDELMIGIITVTDLFNIFIDLFGARQKGVRATVVMDEKPGQLATISRAIADLGGNIISTVTWSAEDAAHRNITLKVNGINEEQMKKILMDTHIELKAVKTI
ncbi:MAG: CBS and ACT domain-containing protein [Treponema sp.]|nr:CBS and ACT domain-containing protein [Treponema sp.]